MSQAARMIEHQILLNMAEMTKLDGLLMRMESCGVAHTDSRLQKAQSRREIVKEATRGWRNKYFNLTGIRWSAVEVPPLEVKVNGWKTFVKHQEKVGKAIQAAVKPEVLKAMIVEYRGRIQEVELKLAYVRDRVKEGLRIRSTFLEELGKSYAESFAFTVRLIPLDLKVKTLPQIDAALAAAKTHMQTESKTGKFLNTHRNLKKAADLINYSLAEMTRYFDGVQRGGKMAIATIKWGAIATTAALTAPLSGSSAILAAMASKGGEEVGTMMGKKMHGEKVTEADVKRALGEVALAGGAASVGEIFKGLAGPVASKVFKTKVPTAAEKKIVEDLLSQAASNNYEEAVKALAASLNGKKVDYDFWSAAVAPLLPADVGAAVKEKDIREGVAAASQ